LLAAVVPVGDTAPDVAVLKAHLAASVPAYMLPQHITLLDALPLTPSGKVDRKALPDPGLGVAPAAESVPPSTPTEQVVAEVWCEALGITALGIHDDVFAHGGHSLLATRVASRLSRRFDLEIPLRGLFEAPTVAQLAGRIEGMILAEITALSEEEARRLASGEP
jgi:hypothetical protein